MVAPDFLSLLDVTDVHTVALEDAHRSVSYAELGPNVRALAASLVRAEVAPGDRVAVLLPNSAASVELYLACALVGAIWVGLNPAAPQAERERQHALVTPALTVTEDILPSLSGQKGVWEDTSPPAPSAPCAIGFTSGTTGTPKALVHSRAGVSLAGAALAKAYLRGDDRVGVILSMSIHNLMVVGAIAALFAGATCVAVERMSAGDVARACRDRRLTMLSALVPATIYDLVHDDSVTSRSLASLRLAGTGAAGLSEELRGEFEAKFGVRLVGSYGMTEAPGVVCLEDAGVPHTPGACGTPLPHLRASTCDDGELTVGPTEGGPWAGMYQPAIGTWTKQGLARRSESEKSFRTGDYGWLDADGSVHIDGRKADVIVRGGVNINAAELESVLGQLPGIRDIAVVGEPDERLGQRIVAFVEPDGDGTIDPTQLRVRSGELLAHGKLPDEFVIGKLPRNAMGKIARSELSYPRIS